MTFSACSLIPFALQLSHKLKQTFQAYEIAFRDFSIDDEASGADSSRTV